MAHGWLSTPFGDISVFLEAGTVVAVEWGRPRETAPGPGLEQALTVLATYMRGQPTRFDIPIDPQGSDFQRRVWRRLREVPWGETTTYGTLAAMLGTAPRAVAGACARNPVPVMIPCHRVVGANGALFGYSGGDGPATKAALLSLEGVRPAAAVVRSAASGGTTGLEGSRA